MSHPATDHSAKSYEVECLASTAAPDILCEAEYSQTPEDGIGRLPALNKAETGFNWLTAKMPLLAAVLLVLITMMITADVIGRQIFNHPFRGMMDIELLGVSFIGFLCLTYAIVERQSIQIDMVYNLFHEKTRRMLYLFAMTLSMCISMVVGWQAFKGGFYWTRTTAVLELPEWMFVVFTGIALILGGVAFFFQACHVLKRIIERREFLSIIVAVALVAIIFYLPFLYKASGTKLSGLALGGLGFLLLMILLMLRVPLGFAMSTIGLIGLLAVVRRPPAALSSVATTPFLHTSTFIMIAFPMFMMMGEMVALSGLSEDLFNAARKWLGRLPGGLACATVAGCAGFGAVCGDSMPTVITMTAVAMPSMRASNYDRGLASGALVAGGTLGILIPPSMGFIMYSMITEESVGKLFMSGILPGILLAGIFIGIIMVKCIRNPSLAPKEAASPMKKKLGSLIYLVPIVILFLVVVLGILHGWFTPAEGGAVGATMATLYSFMRGSMNRRKFIEAMYRCAAMFGKIFALFIGLYILGSFLAASRLPNMLADAVAGLDVNRWLIIAAIILLYIFLGCVMNIMPMMMLTLPSIYPAVQALGFDGIWFGCLCVIIMEMGMITPPVGMNIFTLAGMQPDIPMATIFKGALPFFFGMLLCAILICIFPQIALILVPG